MKALLIAVLLVPLITVLGYSNCPKRYSNFDVEKYNTRVIGKYGLIPSVPRQDVTFRLWTRDQRDVFAPIYYAHLRDEETIRPDQPFKFIIHGWTDCADSDWYEYLRQEYLKKGDYNIIEVDWSKQAGALYPLSAEYVQEVGNYVGELCVDLYRTLGVSLDNIHLIGHSLGAHVSGFAGKYIQKNTNKMLGRITGMDPAGPLYLLARESKRLCPTDAKFVDIIHTDGGKFGYLSKIGHADFYPNGGKAPQPGCYLYGVVDVASCSHTRSYWLFGESINSDKFVATECDSLKHYKNGVCAEARTSIMGENSDNTIRGIFYLTTNTEEPYGRDGEA